MRKSILSIALCLVLLLSMSTTAFAAEGVSGNTTATVIGSYDALEEADTVYYVDVTWGSLEFTYDAGTTKQVWNTTNHSYDTVTTEGKGWTYAEKANVVTVTNYSNTAIVATVTTEINENYNAITAKVTAGESAPAESGSITLESADAGITAENPTGTATTGSVTITLEGELDSTVTQQTVIGTVTVTIADAPAATE